MLKNVTDVAHPLTSPIASLSVMPVFLKEREDIEVTIVEPEMEEKETVVETDETGKKHFLSKKTITY